MKQQRRREPVMTSSSEFVCAYCGEIVETTIDPSAGDSQIYVEDCAVCCRPNVLHVTIDPDTMETEISAEFEG
jgi:hypothetical protein